MIDWWALARIEVLLVSFCPAALTVDEAANGSRVDAEVLGDLPITIVQGGRGCDDPLAPRQGARRDGRQRSGRGSHFGARNAQFIASYLGPGPHTLDKRLVSTIDLLASPVPNALPPDACKNQLPVVLRLSTPLIKVRRQTV